MSHRVNLPKPRPNPELEELLAQARKITSDPEQESEWERKRTRLKTIAILLRDNPHLSRDYVTGIVDMLDRENSMAITNHQPANVQASDYSYCGWLISRFEKRRGGIRFVVEDSNGRLFIHNAKQLGIDE